MNSGPASIHVHQLPSPTTTTVVSVGLSRSDAVMMNLERLGSGAGKLRRHPGSTSGPQIYLPLDWRSGILSTHREEIMLPRPQMMVPTGTLAPKICYFRPTRPVRLQPRGPFNTQHTTVALAFSFLSTRCPTAEKNVGVPDNKESLTTGLTILAPIRSPAQQVAEVT